MISKIKLKSDVYTSYIVENELDNLLSNLNHINFFIGSNNSGKSRFLRTLFTDTDFELELSNFEVIKITKLLEEIYKKIHEELFLLGVDDPVSQNISGVKSTLKQLIEELQHTKLSTINTFSENFYFFWENILKFKNSGGSNHPNANAARWPKVDSTIMGIALDYNTEILTLIPKKINFLPERLYIPILRGLRPIQVQDSSNFDNLKDNYYFRTQNDYFKNSKIKENQIFTGLRLYSDLRKMLLGKKEEREKVKQFENFLSLTFFNSKDVTLTPSIEDDSVHVLIGNDERAIYNIGDGIQSIIILLYPLFFNQGKNLLVFIEEPENSIHPGMQRLLIETLMHERFKSFQYFISTHSNHFLDITLELKHFSVFTVRKTDESDNFHIENVSNEDSRTLDLIGVRNASVFLSNCTIWVEGITDRLYLKKYLEIYQQKLIKDKKIKSTFKEDFNFSFIEYGGGNIVHWSFAEESNWEKIKTKRISTRIFLVVDEDGTTHKPDSAKGKRIALLREELGDNFRLVNGREIENTLSPKIIIDSIRVLEKENFENVKFEEEKIIYEKYYTKKIGEFIDQSFKNTKKKYLADSGTLYCKLDFCKAAIDSINSYDDLSTEAKKLAEDLFSFIKNCN